MHIRWNIKTFFLFFEKFISIIICCVRHIIFVTLFSCYNLNIIYLYEKNVNIQKMLLNRKMSYDYSRLIQINKNKQYQNLTYAELKNFSHMNKLLTIVRIVLLAENFRNM